MLSTQNLQTLPDINALKDWCKVMVITETIINGTGDFQYHFYHSKWSDDEEVFEMDNTQGDKLYILFNSEGAIINGFDHESEWADWRSGLSFEEMKKLRDRNTSKKEKEELRARNIKTQFIRKGVVDQVPTIFKSFIFEPPVSSIGTTFCIWKKYNDTNWQIGNIDFPQGDSIDGSSFLLKNMKGDSEIFKNWLTDYYDDVFLDQELNVSIIENIKNKKPITKETILLFRPKLKNFSYIKKILTELEYPHTI